MEIIIAVLWYLALLMPGNSYTNDDIYNITYDNEQAVSAVIQDDAQMNNAMDHYNNFNPEDNGVQLPADWEKEPVDPYDPIILSPTDTTIFKSDTEKEEGK